MNTPLPSIDGINNIVLTSISLYIVKHIYVTPIYQEKKCGRTSLTKL